MHLDIYTKCLNNNIISKILLLVLISVLTEMHLCWCLFGLFGLFGVFVFAAASLPLPAVVVHHVTTGADVGAREEVNGDEQRVVVVLLLQRLAATLGQHRRPEVHNSQCNYTMQMFLDK